MLVLQSALCILYTAAVPAQQVSRLIPLAIMTEDSISERKVFKGKKSKRKSNKRVSQAYIINLSFYHCTLADTGISMQTPPHPNLGVHSSMYKLVHVCLDFGLVIQESNWKSFSILLVLCGLINSVLS